LTDARVRRTLRLLPLPLCIAWSLCAHGASNRPADYRLCPIQDAVPAFADAPPAADASTPPQVQAQQPTDITGDQLSGTNEKPEFQGNVVLRRGDQFLGTRQLDYDKETGKYVAQGDVRYQAAGIRIVADRAEGDQNADTHNVQNVQYQLMSRRGNGGAEHIEMHGSQGALYGATYSTCPPDDRRWQLRAQRIDIDTDAGTGVARKAVLRVGRVPVLYVPFFPFPIDNRRRTGLLYPTLGSSNRNGFDYRQPYYINLAPNYDLELTPRLMTSRGLQLGGEFRYLTDHGRGVLDAAILPQDRLTSRERQAETDDFQLNGYDLNNRRKDNRGLFHFGASEDLSPTWQARTNLNWISDTRYLEDFHNNLNGLSPFSVTSSIGLYGHGQYWSAAFTADYQQLADYTLTKAVLPYNRLPRAAFNWEKPYNPWLTAGVTAEAVRFQDSAKPGGSRVDLKPYVTLPLEGGSWFIRPTLAWRYTGYQLDNGLANLIAVSRAQSAFGATPTPAQIAGFTNKNPSRSLPIASVDAGLYFDRDAIWGGQTYLQTLEPRLFYLRVPYRNQNDLPLFDTQPLTFSWGQLFRDNRYTGADRQTDANNLTVALTTRLLRQSDGKEKLSLSLGQIHYLSDSQVVTVPCTASNFFANCETPLEKGNSAWVADTTWSVNDRWSIGASYQWDPKFRRQDLVSFRSRYLIGDDGIINFGYRYRRDLLKQVDVSFLYPLTSAWSVVGRYYYSFYRSPVLNQSPTLLEGIAGVQWDSCCLAVRLVGRSYLRGREGKLNNAIQLEIELKGLGSAGADTETRLRRAILGYYREDLYLVPPSEANPGTGDVNTPLDTTP
jgi:LPS-assembly protein